MFNIDQKSKHANIPRTVRFTDPLFNRLKEIAEKEDISFNSLVLQCCSYALNHYYEANQDVEKKTGEREKNVF